MQAPVRPPARRALGIAMASALCLTLPVESTLAGRSAAPAWVQGSRSASLWLAPAANVARPSAMARAVAALDDGKPEVALPIFAGSTSDPVLGGYALLYLARAQLALGKSKEAEFSARQLSSTSPSGYLGESALWLTADAAEAESDWNTAVTALTALTKMRSTSPASAWLRLGRDAANTGDKDGAVTALSRAYYDFP